MAINTYNYTTNQDPNDFNYMFAQLGVHPEYENHIQRWQFLSNSYMGGHEYRLGKYLTRYVYESDAEYMNRLLSTPLDNHVKNIVHTYNSFIYRREPIRDFGSIASNPELEQFMEDADLEGRTLSAFMRDVNIMSTVFGHTLVLLDRPQSNAGTKAEELAQGLRTYAVHYTAPNILDWEFTRLPSGHYELTYLKLLEIQNRAYGYATEYYVREFTKDTVTLSVFVPQKKKQELEVIQETPNELGQIPAVFVYAQRSPTKGIGISDIGDIADTQQALINMATEIEQLIRLQNHPSLVKTNDTDAAAGAGAIITMPNELDGNLKPYLLQPSAQSIEGILESMKHHIQAIDRMAHMGALRAIETRQMSGAAMAAEFTLLDSKLSEKSKNLELAEEQIWRLWSMWQGQQFDGKIKYADTFHIRDKSMDMDLLEKAARTNPTDPRVRQAIDQKILEIIMGDEQMAYSENDIEDEMLSNKEIMVMSYQTEYHYMCPSAVRFAQKMISEGRESQELLQIVQMSDRVFQIEADVERTQTVNQQQITEATNLVNEIKSLATQLLGSAELVGYMDLHLDAIIDPTLAGTLKAE